MIKMIICDGNKIHDLDYDVIRHWIQQTNLCLAVAKTGYFVVYHGRYSLYGLSISETTKKSYIRWDWNPQPSGYKSFAQHI